MKTASLNGFARKIGSSSKPGTGVIKAQGPFVFLHEGNIKKLISIGTFLW